MTRKRLGAIDRDSISEVRGAAEEAARDRRGGSTLKAPPIAQVAGAAARSIEDEILRLRRENDHLQEQGSALADAERDGLVIRLLPLHAVDANAQSRDRRVLDRDSEAWLELKESLRSRGQQVPIEVKSPEGEGGTYGLISGYRRLSALQELLAETGEHRFATVKALVSRARDGVESMVAMIEENEIRQGVSFYERGRICCLAAEQGLCPSVDNAIEALFPNSSRNRRYKIRNFTVIHQRIGSYLDFPEAIGERLGGRLAQALKEGREHELVAVLSDRDSRFPDAEAELLLLDAFVARKPPFTPVKKAAPVREIRFQWEGQGGLRATAKAKGKVVTLKLDGLWVETEAELERLLERIGHAVSD